jgi:hypothetical protein
VDAKLKREMEKALEETLNDLAPASAMGAETFITVRSILRAFLSALPVNEKNAERGLGVKCHDHGYEDEHVDGIFSERDRCVQILEDMAQREHNKMPDDKVDGVFLLLEASDKIRGVK